MGSVPVSSSQEQSAISDIETGTAGGSSLVLAICRVLKIDPPVVSRNREQARWVEAGRVLAARAPSAFRRQLDYVEGLIADLAAASEKQSGDS